MTECLDHLNEKFHIIRENGTRYCRKCGEDLFKCDLCAQWVTLQGYYVCKQCDTKQCFECSEYVENGSKVIVYCGKQVSWNRTCGTELGTGSGLYVTDKELESGK